MWPTVLMETGELINCRRDKWKWTYHHGRDRGKTLAWDFPMLPLDYEGDCEHKVGIENGNKFYCCVCSYTIIRR